MLGGDDLGGGSSRTLDEIREGIRRTMVDDFLRAIPLLASITNDDDDNMEGEDADVVHPRVVHSTGHRWGAAFPTNALLDMDCHIDETRRFVACGDYFGLHHGTVEGAYLSGRAAANRLIRQVECPSRGGVHSRK